MERSPVSHVLGQSSNALNSRSLLCIPVGKSTPSRPRKSAVLTVKPVRANDRFPVPFVGR